MPIGTQYDRDIAELKGLLHDWAVSSFAILKARPKVITTTNAEGEPVEQTIFVNRLTEAEGADATEAQTVGEGIRQTAAVILADVAAKAPHDDKTIAALTSLKNVVLPGE